MEWLANNWTDILLAITSIISGASIIVKMTPTTKDDVILAKIVKFLEIVALNKK